MKKSAGLVIGRIFAAVGSGGIASAEPAPTTPNPDWEMSSSGSSAPKVRSNTENLSVRFINCQGTVNTPLITTSSSGVKYIDVQAWQTCQWNPVGTQRAHAELYYVGYYGEAEYLTGTISAWSAASKVTAHTQFPCSKMGRHVYYAKGYGEASNAVKSLRSSDRNSAEVTLC